MNVIIMRGLPGVGKTTWANKIENAVVCSADDYFMDCGVYKFDHRGLNEAHAQCYAKFIDLVDRGGSRTVVVDNTNTSAWTISPYVMHAKSRGCPVKVVEITNRVSAEELADRNVHGVPLNTIWAMAQAMTEVLPRHWNVEVIR